MTPKYLVEALQDYLEDPTRHNYDFFEALFDEQYPYMKLLDLYQDDNEMIIEYEERKEDDTITD